MKSLTKGLIISGVSVIELFVLNGLPRMNASAATIKTSYTKLTTAGSKRNVSSIGKYALYTKPGMIRGAKLVASRTQMKKFGTYSSSNRKYYASNNQNQSYKGSTYYFRAYGYEVTNTGSVYYKVVTMNGRYRGYVYGGKKVGIFAGGIKSVSTTTTSQTSIPSNWTDTVGIYAGGSLWNYVPYTQYGTKKLGHMTDLESTTIPHLAEFKIDKVAKRTREQDTYYHLVSVDSNNLSGWVKSTYIRTYSEITSNWE
ncbi:hypothetical protein [Levilactobacillus fujinensis]|uniref:GW domain-containing protein n=1 Tax=Levilactobacillus fujinensis TaxID=2486024 RepID=A0ABW1TH49_9LACO|nr:hypothetical protein [Levilactobacillus fujinensis]